MPRKQRMPLSEFLNQFGTEESCRDYLAAQRWPDGFVCPKCGHKWSDIIKPHTQGKKEQERKIGNGTKIPCGI